ncbi:hypothetical protein Hamer_G002535 [Homarus americanus]|uniref:Uncharacterized protein n=1 Tax=Homarus americanus TaxID=6706 RepID=A0A8J5MZ00_HOMAM|nr:hypothetical protein Hamer_G002535 [Homarus americanus]
MRQARDKTGKSNDNKGDEDDPEQNIKLTSKRASSSCVVTQGLPLLGLAAREPSSCQLVVHLCTVFCETPMASAMFAGVMPLCYRPIILPCHLKPQSCVNNLREGQYDPLMPLALKVKRTVLCFHADEYVHEKSEEEIMGGIEKENVWAMDKVDSVTKFTSKRENNSHIDCGCPREKKIPVLELEFIKAQRTKAEGQGSMQMGSIDYSETKKQIANAKKREQIREREQKKKMKSEEAIQREEELCQDISNRAAFHYLTLMSG